MRDFLATLESGSAWAEPESETRGIAHSSFFTTGGPTYGDAFRSRRPPDARDLGDSFRGVAYACAQINANAVAKTPLKQYVTTADGQARPRCDTIKISHRRRAWLESQAWLAPGLTRGDTEVEEVTASPILDVLRRPTRNPDSPFKGIKTLFWFTSISMDIVGSAYWQFTRDGLGVPGEIYPLSPRYIKPIPFAESRPDNRVIMHYLDSWGQVIPTDEIARFRWISLVNPYVSHYSPMEACFIENGVRDKYDTSVGVLLDNTFHPSAIISAKNPDRPIGADVKPRLESDLKKHFTRARAGGVVISDGSLQYDPWQQPQTDVGGLEVTREAKTTICNVFGVPLPLLEMTESNLASATAAAQAHATMAVAPRCELLGEQATGWLRDLEATDPAKAQHGPTNWDRTFLAFDNPVKEDVDARTKVQVSLASIGARTPNEIRRENGDEDVPWGNEPWIAGTLRQPSEPRPEPKAPGDDPSQTKKKTGADDGE